VSSKFLLVIITALMLLSPMLIFEQVHAATTLETKVSSSYVTYADNQTGEISSTRLFLRSGNKLSPTGALENVTASIKCTNGYKQTGLFGFGILPFGTTEWKDVGTWKTDKILEDISFSGNVEYSVWLRNIGERNITGAALEFTLKQDSTTIAGPVLAEEITIPVGQAISTKPVSAKINVSSLAEGKNIGVFIRVAYSSGKNGGDILELVYGTAQYASNARILTNAVKISEIIASKNLIAVRYTDAFGTDWTTAGDNILMVNNKKHNGSLPTIIKVGDEGDEFECSWPVNLKTGINNITVMILYAGPPGWSKSTSIEIPAEKTGGFLPGFEMMVIVAGIAVAFVAFRARVQKTRL